MCNVFNRKTTVSASLIIIIVIFAISFFQLDSRNDGDKDRTDNGDKTQYINVGTR